MSLSFLESELASLEKSVQFLANHQDRQISDPIVREAVDRVKLSVSLLYDTEAYPLILNLINKYKSLPALVPETVGAFLFGCQRVANQPNGFCSPYCHDAVLPSRDHPISCCTNRVYLWSNGVLHPINNMTSNLAQIYTTDRKIPSLTASDLATLSNQGVTMIEIIYIQPTGPHLSVLKASTPINQWISSNPTIKPIVPTPKVGNTRQTNPSSPGWAIGWILLLIIILIIIGLIIYFFAFKR